MKIPLIAAILLLIGSINASAQEQKLKAEQDVPPVKTTAQSETKINVNEIYKVVSTKPESTFNTVSFLTQNLKYPQEAIQNQVSGRVVVQFVVERDGSLSDVQIVRGAEIGNGIPEEAIRVIKAMPKWKPATLSGETVRAYFTMPVSFNLK